MKTLEDEWYIVIKASVNSICRDSMDTQYMIIQNNLKLIMICSLRQGHMSSLLRIENRFKRVKEQPEISFRQDSELLG